MLNKWFAAFVLAGLLLSPTSEAKAPQPSAPTAAKQTIIDINSADATSLASLSGIGPTRAAAIIKGRPYRGKDDLVAKKIIPQAVYDKIKDTIIAKQK